MSLSDRVSRAYVGTGMAIDASLKVYLSLTVSEADCHGRTDSRTDRTTCTEVLPYLKHSVSPADPFSGARRCFAPLRPTTARGCSTTLAHYDTSWRRDELLQFLRTTMWAGYAFIRLEGLVEYFSNPSTLIAPILIYWHDSLHED